nr:metallophosphoesterase [Actinomycetota bacterium]
MSDPQSVQVRPARQPRRRRRWWLPLVPFVISLVLLAVPWWTLLGAQTRWPTVVVVIGTLLFVAVFVALPALMVLGHGGRRPDWATVAADTLLGAVWVLFTCSVLALVPRLALLVAGVEEPTRSRIVAYVVVVVTVAVLAWGHYEAMRVPRTRALDVVIPRLGAGLDGLRVVMVTDTHYGPIDRRRWSAGVSARVNELAADVVCHVGDIADGTVAQRESQAAPLAEMRGSLARVYVTGNHEYYGEAAGWLRYMAGIGWDVLHNKHIVVERGGDQLIVAGVDDATARGSSVPGHGADLDGALAGTDPSLPVLLLAHQPKQVPDAVRAGVDLQVSGHTHGGQI